MEDQRKYFLLSVLIKSIGPESSYIKFLKFGKLSFRGGQFQLKFKLVFELYSNYKNAKIFHYNELPSGILS